MKQYVIDELRLEDHEKIKSWMDENLERSPLGGLYWLPVDDSVLADLQREHSQCSPHVFALELTEERLSCELLVRTKARVTCQCIAYATPGQTLWLMDRIDEIFKETGTQN